MNNNLKIINFLGKNIPNSFTMHELSLLTKIPYATLYRDIKKMNELLDIKIIGKAKIVSLKKDNTIITSYLTISSEEEKNIFLKKQPLLNKIHSELKTEETVILFGSYAKGNEKKDSDIDILIINNSGNKTISFSKYEQIFKKKINPIFITWKEFKQMLLETQENLGKQVLKGNIILKNPEKFWKSVINEQLQERI
jgi:predicted nucleotidyltransferase